MKSMTLRIPKKLIVAPLAMLLAVAPLLCCCFEGVAWASPDVAVEQAPKGCAHCDKKNQSVPKKQIPHECDCPQFLAESGSLNMLKAVSPSELTERYFILSLLSDTPDVRAWRAVTPKIDKHYLSHHRQNPPPAFIIYHTLRI